MAKILLIEDDRDAADIMYRILVKREHDVVRARNEESGVQATQADVFDLILIDYKQSEAGGSDPVELISRLPEDTPIVLVSANLDYFAVQHAALAERVSYILKPLDTRVFGRQVESHLVG